MLAASAGFSIAFSPVKWYDGEAGRIALILIHDSFEQSLIAVFGTEASMIKIWKVRVPELTGRETRRAYIYVPDEAKKHPERRYPVLYMFDGHNVFFDSHATYGKSWGMLEYMKDTKTPMIIAAVECNHSPDNGRLSEYSPFTFSTKELGRITGRGKATMEWFVNRFKPEVDRRFPTLPDREHTFIAGSSMGGLMSLYAVTEYNHVFSRAACLSPSVWVAPKRLGKVMNKSGVQPDTVVYMDYGSEELPNHVDQLRNLEEVMAILLERQVKLDFRIVPGGSHCEASWERQIPFFMQTLLYNLDMN